MILTTAIFQFLRKGHFMFSPVPFLELEVRNASKNQRSMDRGHQDFWINRFVGSWGWFSLRNWNNTCPLPEQPSVRGQWLNWAEKPLSCDGAWTSTPSWNVCAPKKSRKQVVLTPSNTAGRLCRRSSWTLTEKTCYLVLPKGALGETSLK